MPGLPTAAVLGYLLTVTSLFILPYFIFLVSLPEPFPFRFNQLHNPRDLSYHTGWPVSAPCPFAFSSRHWEEVCYGGPVKAASTGAKPSGARAEWMSCQDSQFCDERPGLCAGSDGEENIGSCQPQSESESRVRSTLKTGVGVGGARAWRNAEGLSGDYGSMLDQVHLWN